MKWFTRILLVAVLLASLASPLLVPTEPVRAAPADCYWVNGTGLWSDATNHWAIVSGGAPGAGNLPDSGSNVHFDANSFPGAGQSVTIDAAAYCASMDWTGATNNPTITGASNLNTSGSVTLIAAMTWSTSGAFNINATGTITSNGLVLSSVGWVNVQGVTIVLADTFNLGTKTLYHSSGTFNTNNQTVTCGTFALQTAGAKTLTLGSSIINCTTWNYNGSNLVVTPNTSSIRVTLTGSFSGGGITTYNEVQLNGTSHTVSGSSTFVNLIRNGTATKTDTVTFTSGTTQTVTGNFSMTGNSATNRLLVQSSTLGTAATVNATSWNATQNVDFMDFLSGGIIDLSAITGLSGDCGGNTNVTFTANATQTWDGTTGSWSNAAKWTSRVPLPQDDVSAGGAGNTITVDMPRIGRSITFTGTPTVVLASSKSIYGSLTLTTGMTWTDTNDTYLNGRSSYNITSSGKSFYRIYINAPSGTYILQDDLLASATITTRLLAGTLNLNNYNLTSAYFSDEASTITRTLTMGNGAMILNGTGAVAYKFRLTPTAMTLNPDTSTIILTNSGANAQTFAGGGLSYYNLNVQGAGNYALTIQDSNTFNNVTVNTTTAKKTIRFTDGTNQYVGNLTRDPGGTDNITLTGTGVAGWGINATQPTPISLDYLDISYSKAAPANVFFAGIHSSDIVGNGNWTFNDPALTVTTGTITGYSYTRDGVTTIPLSGAISSINGTPSINTTFDYGLTGAYGSLTPINTQYTSDNFNDSTLTTLIPGQTYFFTANATNNAGNFTGAGGSFTLTLPTVNSTAAYDIGVVGGHTSATLGGLVSDMGVATDTYYYYEWGYDGTFGYATPITTRGATGSYPATITGFSPSLPVYYRAVGLIIGSSGPVYVYGGTTSFAPSLSLPLSYSLIDWFPYILVIVAVVLLLVLVIAMITNTISIGLMIAATVVAITAMVGIGILQAINQAMW